MNTTYNVKLSYNKGEKSLREKLMAIIENAAKARLPGCQAK